MSEFNIIHKYFAPLSKDGLQDDCAALDVPAGHTLLVSTDTLNAGVHFFADTPPDIIARKALRSTVSDIYASGGRPLAYQLAIGFPRPPAAEWLAAFTEGLAADQARGLQPLAQRLARRQHPPALKLRATGHSRRRPHPSHPKSHQPQRSRPRPR